MGVWREALEMELHVLVNQLVLREQVRESPELGVGRQVPINEQVSGLDERRFLSKLLDRNSAVAKDALLAVDKGDFARARPGIAESGVERDGAGLAEQLAHIDRPFPGGSLDDGQRYFLPIPIQLCRLIHGTKVLRLLPGKINSESARRLTEALNGTPQDPAQNDEWQPHV